MRAALGRFSFRGLEVPLECVVLEGPHLALVHELKLDGLVDGHELGAHDGIAHAVVGDVLISCRDLDGDLVLTEPQFVAVEQALRMPAPDGGIGAVDVDAVATRVDEIVRAGLEVDQGMAAGDEALFVGQHPVVVGGAADGAAAGNELPQLGLTQLAFLMADDSKTQRHDDDSRAGGMGAPG